MSEEEGTGGEVVKLSIVVALHGFDGGVELGVDVCKKMREGGKGVGFEAKGNVQK